MCGIVGKFNLTTQATVTPELLLQMIGVQQHRGPDESGIYIDDRIGLGHARLSIIDLEKGSQPIHNEDQTLWIIYNGEVFNYPELRNDLINRGHSFYTSSDTEVILHHYEEKGPACLDDLNGQFAFAIWDAKKKELFLARDRVGIRPLYYTIQKGHLLFASEIKALFMDRSVPREIDSGALNQIFTFWTTLSEKTFFKHIHELPPGHYLKASNGQTTITKYWEPPFYPAHEHIRSSPEEICEHIQELLMDAIRIRLRADVPVGCYLSGGLDSSGVTTLVVKNFNSKVRTFGIRFDEEPFDEGAHQNLMVSFLRTDHTDIQATNEKIGTSLPDVLWHCEKPLLRTAPVPLFLLSDIVHKSNFKVVLTGEGADEVFGGYNIFREAKVRSFWAKQPDSKLRGLLIGRLYPYIFNNPRMLAMQQSFFAAGLEKSDDPFFSHHIRWNNTNKIKTFLSEDIRQTVNSEEDYEKLKQKLPDSFASWDYLARAQYLEMNIFLSNYLLSSQGDRVAMAHSVEIRLPYLDYRIIDFMAKVPSHLKINGLKEKHILKKSFEGILPQEITSRDKHPYRAPIVRSLLHASNSEYTRELLSEKTVKDSGLFDSKKVTLFLKKISNAKEPGEVDSMALAGILSSQIVYDRFIKHFPDQLCRPAVPDIIVDRRSGENTKAGSST